MSNEICQHIPIKISIKEDDVTAPGNLMECKICQVFLGILQPDGTLVIPIPRIPSNIYRMMTRKRN